VATKLFLKNTTTNGITVAGTNTYDMDITAPASADTCVVNTTASGTEIQFTKTAGGNVVQWVSGRVPAGGFTLTNTDISINALENNMSANIGGRYRVFKITKAGVVTELASGPFDDGVEFGTVDGVMTWTGDVTDTAFAEDDRVLLRLYITNVGTMATGFTGTLQFNGASAGTSDCFFDLNENVTFKTNQSRYYVGGAANWDGTAGTKWAGVDGGTGGATVPTTNEDVFFTATSGAVTVTRATTSSNCRHLDCTGFTGTITGSQAMQCNGNLKLVAGMTFSDTGTWAFGGTSSQTVTMGGKSFGNDIEFNAAGGTWQLQDGLTTTGALSLTNGTLDTNGQAVSSVSFVSSNSNTRALTLGATVWSITGTAAATLWNIATSTGMTLSAGTSEIKFTGNSTSDKTFAGGGLTYNNVTNDTNGTGKFIVSGANTFNVFDVAKTNNSRTVQFPPATVNTFTSFKRTAGTGHTLQSSGAGVHELTQISGTNSVSNLTIDHSIATGGASWQALTSNTNVDGGVNTGWIFAAGSEQPKPFQPWYQQAPIMAQ
jgi:hypothetical protein